MNLLRENQDSKKSNKWQYIIGVILCVLTILLLSFSLGNHFAWFIDVPSLLILAGICGAIVLLSGKKDKKSIVTLLRHSVFPAGIVSSLSGFIAVLGNIASPDLIGPNLAVAILSILYAAIVYLILLVIEQHI